MSDVALIVGTGAELFDPNEPLGGVETTTEWGDASSPLYRLPGVGRRVVALLRHGPDHRIPPHRVNYRANIALLKAAGIRQIIAVNAVGGIHEEARPGRLVIPDQLIDYTWGREHTFHDTLAGLEGHCDFTEPFSENLRQRLLDASVQAGLDAWGQGVCGVMQGPRLETAAEIDRLEGDGADIVSMTLMPEAALAREAGLEYASCAMVVNWAAGRGDEAIHSEISSVLASCHASVAAMLRAFLTREPALH